MELLRTLDISVVSYVNSFVGQSESFDRSIVVLVRLDTFKGAVITALLWYVWLIPDRRLSSSCPIFVPSIIGTFAAALLARGLQLLLPLSHRPMHDPALDFIVPAGMNPTVLAGASSFPSDHAVLYFAVATAVFLANRQAGIFAYTWAAVLVCLPRLYVGLHYPSDLLVGAATGVLIMWAAFKTPWPAFIANFIRGWEERQAASLYVVAFLFSFSVATVFDEPREVIKFALNRFAGIEL